MPVAGTAQTLSLLAAFPWSARPNAQQTFPGIRLDVPEGLTGRLIRALVHTCWLAAVTNRCWFSPDSISSGMHTQYNVKTPPRTSERTCAVCTSTSSVAACVRVLCAHSALSGELTAPGLRSLLSSVRGVSASDPCIRGGAPERPLYHCASPPPRAHWTIMFL